MGNGEYTYDLPSQRIPLFELELPESQLQESVASNPMSYEDVPDCTPSSIVQSGSGEKKIGGISSVQVYDSRASWSRITQVNYLLSSILYIIFLPSKIPSCVAKPSSSLPL